MSYSLGRRHLAVSMGLVVALVACSRRDADRRELVRADPVASASPSLVETPLDFGPPGPVTIAPAVPAPVMGMMDHADLFGWSKDGAFFGYCQTDGGMGARHCGLWPRAGKPELFDDIDHAKGELDAKKGAAIDARMKALALSIPTPRWDYARDVEVVWEVFTLRGLDDAGEPLPEREVMMVGGRVRREGEPPAYVVKVEETSSSIDYAHIHPEAIAVSPDGRMLGVVGHAFAGEFSDAFPVALVPMAKIAAAAYEEAAHAHQQNGDTAMAAELSRKARAVH